MGNFVSTFYKRSSRLCICLSLPSWKNLPIEKSYSGEYIGLLTNIKMHNKKWAWKFVVLLVFVAIFRVLWVSIAIHAHQYPLFKSGIKTCMWIIALDIYYIKTKWCLSICLSVHHSAYSVISAYSPLNFVSVIAKTSGISKFFFINF